MQDHGANARSPVPKRPNRKWDFVVKRQYSALSPPPARGFVLYAFSVTGDHPRVQFERLPILGAVLCHTATWHRPHNEDGSGASPSHPQWYLEQLGYRLQDETWEIVPVVLHHPQNDAPFDEDIPEQRQLAPITETLVAVWDVYETVWCTWPAEEDERHFKGVEKRLRKRQLEVDRVQQSD